MKKLVTLDNKQPFSKKIPVFFDAEVTNKLTLMLHREIGCGSCPKRGGFKVIQSIGGKLIQIQFKKERINIIFTDIIDGVLKAHGVCGDIDKIEKVVASPTSPMTQRAMRKKSK